VHKSNKNQHQCEKDLRISVTAVIPVSHALHPILMQATAVVNILCKSTPTVHFFCQLMEDGTNTAFCVATCHLSIHFWQTILIIMKKIIDFYLHNNQPEL